MGVSAENPKIRNEQRKVQRRILFEDCNAMRGIKIGAGAGEGRPSLTVGESYCY